MKRLIIEGEMGDVVDKLYNYDSSPKIEDFGKTGEREKGDERNLAVETLFPGLSIRQKKESNISFQPKAT